MRNNVYSDIYWYKDMLLPVSGKICKFQNFMYNIYDKLWGDDINLSYIIHEILKIFIFFQIQVIAYPCINIISE